MPPRDGKDHQKQSMITDTIAAIATPPGTGGIGIIKISGPAAIGMVLEMFRPSHNDDRYCQTDPRTWGGDKDSHRLWHGRIIDPDSNTAIDEVLLAVMRAPHSYTREDVIEIQAHAGPAAMHQILTLVLARGARLAEPGEFTRRAFLNGRIDLTQAEAVIDLITARSETALKAAANQMSGQLRMTVETFRATLTDLLVHLEAAIDFPDDIPEEGTRLGLGDILLHQVAIPIEGLLREYRHNHIFRDGLNLAIIGRPNVGKSSLLNCLVAKERAIVNPLPGTTRDIIQEDLQLRGVPVRIFDTAGIHPSMDAIEQIGIRKARECLEEAHVALLVFDVSEEPTSDDLKLCEATHGKPVIGVFNKIDLVNGDQASDGYWPKGLAAEAVVRVSALYGTGIDGLKDRIVALAGVYPERSLQNGIIPNLRHQEALKKCLASVRAATDGLRQRLPVELVVIDIKSARDRLDEILGIRVDADVLDHIFSRFCIGK